MTEFIGKYHLLKETQSGHREGHSTNKCNNQVDFLRAMNKSEITLAVLQTIQ